jgi:ethanolamine kinase
LIDFEYGGINYRAFDIANHFNEYAGGPPDCAIPKYKEHFPNLSQQRHFIECYLQAAARVRQNRNRNLQHDKCNGSAHNHSTEAAAAAAIAAPTEVTEHDEQDETAIKQEDVDALMVEVELFLLVNHLYWGLWAVNQGTASATSVASSTTDNAIETSTAHKVDLPDDVAGYDYTTYAIQRIQQYWIAKARYEEERSKPC